MVGFSSVFYGVPDLLAGMALLGAHGLEALFGYVGLFALARGIMTFAGGGLADPGSFEYKLFYGGGDFLIAGALLPGEAAYFFLVRGIASAVGLVL